MKPTLGLFLELGGCLEEWDTVGFFSREISLYNSLAREYFDRIYIFTYGSERDLRYNFRLEKNITVLPRGARSKSYIINFLYELWIPIKYRSVLRQCTVYKTNQNSGSIAATLAKILFGKKLIIRSGYIGSELARRSRLSLLVKGYYFFAEQLSYRMCDRALISAEPNKQLLDRHYPFLKDRLITHNNFIDTDLFTKNNSIEKSIDIVYVARFNRDKNHELILNAIRNTTHSALFIGQGERLPSIRARAHAMNLRVTFRDSVPNEDLPFHYNTARICAFPSLHEGSPKALLEAMACALPIVALPAPGITNVITNGTNGLIGDETDFKANVERLLNDQELCDKLGQSARKTVIEAYSFKRILQNEIEIYQNL